MMKIKAFLTASLLAAGIADATAQDAMNIVGNGDVGIGTAQPIAPLHVYRDDGTASVLVQELDPDPAGRTLFSLANRGNTKFEIKEVNSGTRWQFTNSGDAFRVSKFGTGLVEFQVFNNGDAALAGTLSENSDRNAKTGIEAVDSQSILDKVVALPIAHWSYIDAPDSRHIGPMAQDFRAAFGTGNSDTSLATLDTSGVALAAIQALEHRNRSLETRVAELESMLERLLEVRTAHSTGN